MKNKVGFETFICETIVPSCGEGGISALKQAAYYSNILKNNL